MSADRRARPDQRLMTKAQPGQPDCAERGATGASVANAARGGRRQVYVAPSGAAPSGQRTTKRPDDAGTDELCRPPHVSDDARLNHAGDAPLSDVVRAWSAPTLPARQRGMSIRPTRRNRGSRYRNGTQSAATPSAGQTQGTGLGLPRGLRRALERADDVPAHLRAQARPPRTDAARPHRQRREAPRRGSIAA